MEKYSRKWNVARRDLEYQKNGEVFLEWLNISAVKDETGEDVRYVGTFTDVTAHRTNEGNQS